MVCAFDRRLYFVPRFCISMFFVPVFSGISENMAPKRKRARKGSGGGAGGKDSGAGDAAGKIVPADTNAVDVDDNIEGGVEQDGMMPK